MAFATSFFLTNAIFYNMKKTYKGQSIFSEIKYTLSDCFRQNKLKFIISGCVLLIALLTGIIIAIKHYDSSSIHLSNYGLVNFKGGILSSSFFSRLFSMLLIMLLLLGCCFTSFTFPIAILILAYRTYLLALNLTLLFILYGIPGMLISLIIALPCQLMILLILLMFYILLYSNNIACKKYGNNGGGASKLKLALIVLLLLFICNLSETILLAIFNVNVILVI